MCVLCVCVFSWGARIDMVWFVRNTFDVKTAVGSPSVVNICVCYFGVRILVCFGL